MQQLIDANPAVSIPTTDKYEPPPPEAMRCSRSRRVSGYDRQTVPDEKLSWKVPWSDYQPPFFEAEKVIANDRTKKEGGWADPVDMSRGDFKVLKDQGRFKSNVVSEVELDSETCRPLNPCGRTGLEGRGILGKWGPNQAVDAIIIYFDESIQKLKLLVIDRPTGERALPGGFVDDGEESKAAVLRELQEETSLRLADVKSTQVFSGYSDDERNTDNAWIETTASLYVLSHEEGRKLTPRASAEARRCYWITLEDAEIRDMYASHAYMIKKALQTIEDQSRLN